jgi:hypothetical protein
MDKNGRTRSFGKLQNSTHANKPRRGLSVYATEDIEYAQELLMVNREYPVTLEEAPHAAVPRPDAQTPTSADTEAIAEMSITDTPGISLVKAMEGR